MSTYTLNTPQIDYLTMTTKSYELYLTWKRMCMRKSVGNPLPTKPFTLLDYAGMVSADGSVSVGSRTREGSEEYIVQLSGPTTEALWRSIVTDEKYNITRIDVAYMSSAKEYPKPEELLLLLTCNGVACSLESGKDGVQTLYIGKRNTVRYIRVYEKVLTDSQYLRLEVECKKGLASRLGIPLLNDETVRYALLAGSVEKMPLVFQSQLSMPFGEVSTRLPRGESVTSGTAESYRDWFRDVVAPSLLKRMRSASRLGLGTTEYALEYKELLAMLQTELDTYIEEVRGVEKVLPHEETYFREDGKKKPFRYGTKGNKRPSGVDEEELTYSDDRVWRSIEGYD